MLTELGVGLRNDEDERFSLHLRAEVSQVEKGGLRHLPGGGIP